VFSTAALAAVLYGLSDEVHQSFIPGRDASVGDVVADALGALLGAAAWVVGCRVLGRFTSRVRRDTRPG
jgi:VanZ family protein